MSESQTIIQCDRCGAFRPHEPLERWSSHDCASCQWGWENFGLSTWVISRVCANCGGPATGFAMIDHLRYCHDGSSEMPPSLASSNPCFALAWRTSARDQSHLVSFNVTAPSAGSPRVMSTKMQHRDAGPAVLSDSVDDVAASLEGSSV